MKSLKECEEYRSDSKIVLEENKSKITFLNPNKDKILEIRIDGCVIKDDKTLRCDFAIVHKDTEIYVELKGSDIPHAVKQIKSTINLLSNNPQKIKKKCFVVSTRVPKLSTSIQKLQIELKKDFNADFRVKNIQDEYDLSSLN